MTTKAEREAEARRRGLIKDDAPAAAPEQDPLQAEREKRQVQQAEVAQELERRAKAEEENALLVSVGEKVTAAMEGFDSLPDWAKTSIGTAGAISGVQGGTAITRSIFRNAKKHFIETAKDAMASGRGPFTAPYITRNAAGEAVAVRGAFEKAATKWALARTAAILASGVGTAVTVAQVGNWLWDEFSESPEEREALSESIGGGPTQDWPRSQRETN